MGNHYILMFLYQHQEPVYLLIHQRPLILIILLHLQYLEYDILLLFLDLFHVE